MPHNHTHLCNSVGIEGVGTHGAEVVEDCYGVIQGQQLLLVVLKYGDGIAEEDLAPLIEEGVPYVRVHVSVACYHRRDVQVHFHVYCIHRYSDMQAQMALG